MLTNVATRLNSADCARTFSSRKSLPHSHFLPAGDVGKRSVGLLTEFRFEISRCFSTNFGGIGGGRYRTVVEGFFDSVAAGVGIANGAARLLGALIGLDDGNVPIVRSVK